MYIYRQYASNQVFQEKKNFIIEGKTSDEKISAKLLKKNGGFESKTLNVSILNGVFTIEFKGVDASFDKYEIVLSDSENEVILENIRFGDVFTFNGQSNMCYGLKAMINKDEYVKEIETCDISILNLEEGMIADGSIHRPNHRLDETFFTWETLNKDNLLDMPGLPVMTSVKLSKKLNKPIGVIVTAVGGCSIDTYIPYEAVLADKPVYNYLIKTNRLAKLDKFNTYGIINYTQTSGLYFEKIYPIRYLKSKCFLWYQGENSCWDFDSAKYYKSAIKLLIKEMRKTFNDYSLPFLITGIADEYYPYGDSYGYIYIQEVLSKIKGKNIIYVPIHDAPSDWFDLNSSELFYHPIHPIVKEGIANRYLDFIYNNIYLKKPYFSPYIESFYINRNSIILNIKHMEKGLKVGQEYFGFTIASENKKYHNAKAVAISDSEIELYSPSVNNPVYYTYGIMQYSNLLNCKTMDNLPLSISRSVFESIDSSTYLLNALPFALKEKEIIENNFGPETGTIKPIKIYENGDIVRERMTKIKLSKGILSLSLNPRREEYYFSSVRINVSLSGAPSNLSKYKYFMVRMKTNSKCILEGILIRYNGMIYKFGMGESNALVLSEELSNSYRNYYINLEKTVDGSNAIYDCDKKILEAASSVELYFKSFEKNTVSISKLDLVDEMDRKIEAQEKKEEIEIDASMFLNH